MSLAKQKIIADTGFFLALNNTKDPYLEKTKKFLRIQSNSNWVTTWPVITETCYLLSRFRPESAQIFLKNFAMGAFEVFHLDKAHMSRICALMAAYQELPMDLADASLVLLAEDLGHGQILTTDKKDFQIYRWGNKKHFENLLF